MKGKLAFAVLVIMLALFLLVVRLYDIIDTNYEDYKQTTLTQQGQRFDSKTLPYKRGSITDRNGTYLAVSEKVYNLILDPNQIMSGNGKERYLETTVQALSQCFGYDAAEIRKIITDNPESYYIPYEKQISNDKKVEFENLKEQIAAENEEKEDKSERVKRVKGVWFEEEYKRVYPYNSVACNIIGFAQSDGAGGNGGIEQYYNSDLIGVNGREYGYLNEETNLERVIKEAQNGSTVVSTIDLNIQKILEKYLQEWESTTGSKMSAAIAMNPKNGEVLAMANKNMFDLNNPRDLQGRYTQEELEQLGIKEAVAAYKRENDGKTISTEEVYDHYTRDEVISYGTQVAWNQIWRNFCISDTYEPGSPSKVFTVAAGLEEGVLNPNLHFMCDGGQVIAGEPIRCVNRYGHGDLTLAETLMVSCNDGLMQMASMEGSKMLSKYLRLFGFGSKTGIDLPGEADTSTLLHDPETMRPADLATNSFGQNYNCTMIQIAAAYCSIVNGGSYYEPHVVKQVLNDKGSVVKKIEPKLVRETVSASTSEFLKDAMFQTVSGAKGTGKVAAVKGYEVGGKTGTAQKYPRGNRKYLVSFAGFAPVNDPQIVLYVIIDEPNVEDQAHSSFAMEVFQKMLTEILPYMNVFPTVDLPSDTPDELKNILPEEEGISEPEMTGTEAETEAADPADYPSEEYVDNPSEGEENLPANEEAPFANAEYEDLPGEIPGGGADETEESSSLTEEGL